MAIKIVGSIYLVVALTSCKLLKSATALVRNSDVPLEDVVDFLSKGHVILRNILPELKEKYFQEQHEYAKNQASKAYSKYALQEMGCNETGMDFMDMAEVGDGSQALKACLEHVVPDGMEENERYNLLLSRKPFHQLVNLHEYSSKIHEVAFGQKFATLASDLLQVEKIRLYQTRTFRKVPSKDDTMRRLFNHPTYMHTDLGLQPLDTNEYVTIWCPTRDLTHEDSVLTYASGSHRDIATQRLWDNGVYEEEEMESDEDESEEDEEIARSKSKSETNAIQCLGDQEGEECEKDKVRVEEEDLNISGSDEWRYGITWYDDLRVGDCVAHHGWLLHGSTSQVHKNGPRDALTFSYIDGDAYKLASAKDRHSSEFMGGDIRDDIMFRDWFYDVPEGEIVDHPKLPLVWPKNK